MRAFVFCLAVMFVSVTQAEDQYTLDSIQTYFDLCAAEGKMITAPTLSLTVASRPGHIGRLVGNYVDTTRTFRVTQQTSEGTLVTVNYFRMARQMEMQRGNAATIRPIGGTDATVGPFLFKYPEIADLQTDATFTPLGLWQVTSSHTYNTAGGGSRTVLIVEPLPEGKVDIPSKLPHRFLRLHQARDWRKLGGVALTRGVYVGYRGGVVWIMDKDNEIIKHSLFQLSSEDQNFIRKEIKQKRREHLIPELEIEWKRMADRDQK